MFMKCFKCVSLVYLRREKEAGEKREREGEAVNVKRKGKGLNRISSSITKIFTVNLQPKFPVLTKASDVWRAVSVGREL